MSYHIPPPVRRRVEGYRWLRSDGKPNWNQHITRSMGEVLLIASKPPILVKKDSTVLEAVEKIASNNVRGLPVLKADETLHGVLTSTDLVNYMGGGVLFEIIEKKYNYNIYDALEKTAVESLVKKEPVWVGSDSRIDEVLRLMVEHGTGFLPVVDKSGTVAGVVTEHDLVKHLAGKETGRTVAEVMSRTVIGIDVNDTLWDAMKLMVKHGFRRLLVFREDKLEGSITAKSIVTFFGNHKAFEYVKTGDIRDVLNIEVAELYTPYYTVAKPNEDIGIVADRMMKTGLSGLPVVEDENVVGVVTERDVLFGLLSR